MAEESQAFDVVAVGAHPDDVEIACGGTLAKLVEQGHRVGIIDLTDGEPTPGSPGPETRLEEAKQAAVELGVAERVTLDLPNRKLFDNYESRVKLATWFRRWRPRLVIGFGDKTPLASPDHWQAMQITDAAIFYSRLTKWDDEFEGTPPHTIDRQLYFSLVFNSLAHPPNAGHIVVDIASTLDKKMASVLAYKTQFAHRADFISDRIRAFAMQQGFAAGLAAGELFISPRTMASNDLMRTVLGE